MIRTRFKLTSIALVLAMAVSMGASGIGVAATSGGNDATHDATSDDAFALRQGGDCYVATAVGDGSQNVSSFYDYNASGDYSSVGTTHLQENQVSNLFVYNGSEGYSLVFLHDEVGDEYGSTTTFTITGLPESGTWAVEDDGYPDRDDSFVHDGTRSEIDWKWGPFRTDGAAFRGLNAEENVSITVEPEFNERADAWGDWRWSGDATNRTESWRFLGENGTTVTTLNMTENVTVGTGLCDQTAPSASLSVNSTNATVDESVTFNASNTTGDQDVVEYRWDFDGDGSIDRNTSSATTTHAYANGGEYEATVTVVDAAGDTDATTATVDVAPAEDSEAPTATLHVPDEVTVNETFTVKATNVTDESGIAHVCWYYDGQAGPDGKTATLSFAEPGDHTVTLSLKDDAGNHRKISRTVTVVTAEDGSPTAKLEASKPAVVGEKVHLDATASYDNEGIVEYHWDIDSDGELEHTSSRPHKYYSYDTPGEYQATVTVVDAAGNEDSATATVDVAPADTEAPTATLDVPDEVTLDETFSVKATDVSDESAITHVCWLYDGEPGPEGQKTATLSFAEPGDHTVALSLKDAAGNHRKITRTVTVAAADDSEPPTDDDETDDPSGDERDDDPSDDETTNDDTSDSTDSTDASAAEISIESVRISDEDVAPGETVTLTVTVENTGDAAGSRTVALSVDGFAGNRGDLGNGTNVTVSPNETRTVSVSTSFEEAGKYDVRIGNRTHAIDVHEAAPAQSTETSTDTPTDGDPNDRSGTDDTPTPTTGGSGPGFGIVGVLVAALIAVLALYRRR